MARSWRNLTLSLPFPLHSLPCTRNSFQVLSQQNVVVLGKITPLLQPETNLFVGVSDQGLYKMQNPITVPLSMLGIALINIGKLCWPWEVITVKISINGKGVPVSFTH